ncbi:MAG: hypothetical protein IT457_20220 [Planctomycetes bacterium]|nr:hypothetical protein [Planctomycetota bacterium]
MNWLARTILSVSTCALAACGSIPTKTFHIEAINFEGEDVPCLVEVDDKFDDARTAARYTPCDVTVAFTKDQMTVRVYPTRRDEQGQVIPPEPNARGKYYEQSRLLQMIDPTKHVFVLRENQRVQN